MFYPSAAASVVLQELDPTDPLRIPYTRAETEDMEGRKYPIKGEVLLCNRVKIDMKTGNRKKKN